MSESSKKRQWKFSTSEDGEFIHAPIQSDGRVYIGSNFGELYCLNDYGEPIWSFSANHAFYASPTAANGTIFAGNHDGYLYALDDTNGIEQWVFNAQSGISSKPVVTDNRVYFGADDNSVYALDSTTGMQQWEYSTRGSAHVDPLILGDGVYFGDSSGVLYCLDKQSGAELATYQLTDSMCRGLYAAGDRLLASADDHVFAFRQDQRGLYKVWEQSFYRQTVPPVVTDETVFCATYGGRVVGLDIQTGDMTFEFDTGEEIYTGPGVVNDTLYVGCKSGSLYQFSASEPDTDTIIYAPDSDTEDQLPGGDADGTEIFHQDDSDLEINFCPACGADLEKFDTPEYCPVCGESIGID